MLQFIRRIIILILVTEASYGWVIETIKLKGHHDVQNQSMEAIQFNRTIKSNIDMNITQSNDFQSLVINEIYSNDPNGEMAEFIELRAYSTDKAKDIPLKGYYIIAIETKKRSKFKSA